MDRSAPVKPILCPSAQPNTADAKVFGVFIDTIQVGMRVGYLAEAQPITPAIVALRNRHDRRRCCASLPRAWVADACISTGRTANWPRASPACSTRL
jgi:hypothetical protein